MEQLFNMTQKDLSRYNLMLKTTEEGLTQVKASELLGVSDRQFRRLLKAYREKGPEGLLSKKRGRPSNRRLKDAVKEKVVSKLTSTYIECGPTFAWEKLVQVEKIQISRESVRKIMMEQGLWEPKRRRRITVHQQRNRRAHEGELVQMDGSPHAWFEDRADPCCLLGFIDDATSKIKHLKFVNVESTASYFTALQGYMRKHGKPNGYYSDRFSVFRVNNDKEGYRKAGLTQVGRALKELGVELICANSPQAKGRVERLFNTLQDRLVKEMRLKGISSIEAGNQYLEEYIEEHNRLFAVTANNPEDVHQPVTVEDLERAFCYKEERQLSKNLEISYCGRILQIQAQAVSYALKGARVIVEETLARQIKIVYQGKALEYKELLVRDHQGQVKNRKEILIGSGSLVGAKTA